MRYFLSANLVSGIFRGVDGAKEWYRNKLKAQAVMCLSTHIREAFGDQVRVKNNQELWAVYRSFIKPFIDKWPRHDMPEPDAADLQQAVLWALHNNAVALQTNEIDLVVGAQAHHELINDPGVMFVTEHAEVFRQLGVTNVESWHR